MPLPPKAEELWPRRRTFGLVKGASAPGWQRQWRELQLKAFAQVGRALMAREAPKRRRAPPPRDPVIVAVAGDDQVTRLIGEPVVAIAGEAGPWPDAEAPSWISIDAKGSMPLVRLGFRGALIRTVFHREVDNCGRVLRVEATESERLYSFEALKEAAEAARQALRRAGFTLSAFVEVEQLHGGQSAEAAIGLRSLSPARARGPTMAR